MDPQTIYLRHMLVIKPEKRDRKFEREKGFVKKKKEKKRGKKGRNVIWSVRSRRLRSSLVSPRVFVHDSPGLRAKTNLLHRPPPSLWNKETAVYLESAIEWYPTFGKVFKKSADRIRHGWHVLLSLFLFLSTCERGHGYRTGFEFPFRTDSLDDISPDVIKNWTPRRRGRFRWLGD